MLQLREGWSFFVNQFRTTPPWSIMNVGRYLVKASRIGASDTIIGEFYCLLIDPAPLTPERIAAIKSDPRATKAVRITVSCNACYDSFSAYAGFDRDVNLERERYVWYQDIPDRFTCGCGRLDIDLRSMKKNLYAPLGQLRLTETDLVGTPLYERGALENIRVEFSKLIESNSKEEPIQKFLEDNPIILRQFPAERILFKPPILTRYVADFAVLTPQLELILIEIETVKTALLKKDGDQAAPLTHAVNQVQNWLQVFDEHRLACLAEQKIAPELVAHIRGVVIAGRDKGYDTAHLRTLKSIFSGRISLLTYDDLTAGLGALVEQIGRL